MECIKSLQNNTNRVQSRLNNLETMTSSREEEVTASLQDVANCMGLAKTERSQLQQLISDRWDVYFNDRWVCELAIIPYVVIKYRAQTFHID